MPGNPIQDVLQMLMQQGGGGMPGGAGMPPGAMPPGGGNIPMMQGGPQQAEIAPLSPQSQGMAQGGEPPPTGDFLPPQMPMPQGEPPMEGIEGMMDDPRRAETEGELEDVRSQMQGASTEDDDYEWQGDETPTAMDMEYMKENPTDSVLHEFYTRFPKYMMELILSEGGNPRQSPDQYAMDDEEFENLQSDRSTMIDER